MANPRVVPGHVSGGPIARDAYEALAGAYADQVDTRPHNAYYERPATLSLLPEVNGMRVLDAGCGPGAYAAWLVERGATVVGFDASPGMVSIARERVHGGAIFHVADFERELVFVEPASFDLVIAPLSLDPVRDLGAVFGRFHRALRSSGHLVFSMGHPFFEFCYFRSDDYFATQAVSSVWRGFGPRVEMPSFRRPMSAIMNPLIDAGFRLERLLEPRPTDAFREADPETYAELMEWPSFLCVRARKRSAGSGLAVAPV